MVNVSELPSASEAAEASEAAVSRVPVPEVRLLRPAGLGAAVLAVPVALGLALAVFVAECAALVWWVLGPCARSLSRRER